MEIQEIQRVDHLGIVAGTMRDLELVSVLDTNLGIYETEKISVGTVISGLILNGLGFTSRPLSLVPQFFEKIPVEHLLGEGVSAADFDRFKTGRCLDRIAEYGCERLFEEVARHCAKQAGICTSYIHSDTTSVSVSGEYDSESDEQTIRVVHGYSKDHRPDLKQVVLELLVSNDGGVPLFSRAWDGNKSDSVIFTERTRLLKKALLEQEWSPTLIGDSKLYSKENVSQLGSTDFITRIPGTLKEVKEQIAKAHGDETSEWNSTENGSLHFKEVNLTHYDIDQRWLICWSQESKGRAEIRREKAETREFEKVQVECAALERKVFHCEKDAQREVNNCAKRWKYHRVVTYSVVQSGKKKKKEIDNSQEYSVVVSIELSKVDRETEILRDSSFIIGTSLTKETLSNDEVIVKYKEQQKVERGFRFLKDPLFFTSSLFLKSPARIDALLCIMSMALMVYSIAERTLRKSLQDSNQTIPNQINKPISNPTLRWVFQCFEGISFAVFKTNGIIKRTFDGLTPLRQRIIACFGEGVRSLYQTNTG